MTKQISHIIPQFNLVRLFGALAVFILLSGCFPKVEEEISKFNSLKSLKRYRLPKFSDDFDYSRLSASIDNSLAYYKKVPLDRKYQFGKQQVTAGHMINSLETFQAFIKDGPSPKALNRFIRSKFTVYQAAGNEDRQVLFTGYFEPTYKGSLEMKEPYIHPVYSVPDDLLKINLSTFSDQYKGHKPLSARINLSDQTVVPYYARKEINSIADFDNRSIPVVWLESRVDRFFLEIQGSGRILLDNNDVLRLHYAASNGRAYRSIGRYLIQKNEIPKEEMSMQAIRKWLEKHPDRMDEVLHQNDSFVFFKKEKGGPFGALGVEVTAFRSIAADLKLYPKGALCFIESMLPQNTDNSSNDAWQKSSFFALNQDTGGAIRGSARADIFCGNDAYAQYTAGHMNIYGRLFFLVLTL